MNSDDAASHWRPVASRDVLVLRARLVARMREYFAGLGVLEVDTPALSASGNTDPNIHSFSVDEASGGLRYLHTSPEFPMKRLVAAGYGDIYQLAKVFRNGEAGRLHNPEFTMLEWYRVGLDHHEMMAEVTDLLGRLLATRQRPTDVLTYSEAFERHAGFDPLSVPLSRIQAAAGEHAPALGDDRDAWLDLVMVQCVAPRLGRGAITHLYNYPPSQAALAKIAPTSPPVAQRFETWIDGVEIANGYHELNDAKELEKRFAAENARRLARGTDVLPVDAALLAATRAGMPDCAGVALGFDRVVMLAAGLDDVRQTLAFPYARA